MPEHDRQPRRVDLAVAQVQIGPAHAAGADLEQQLAGAGPGIGEGRRDERLPLALQDHRTHIGNDARFRPLAFIPRWSR